jgi:hypothetical protein
VTIRNTLRVLTVAIAAGIACTGSSIGAGSRVPLPTFTAAGAEGRPVLLWKVVSSDKDRRRLFVAVQSGMPTGVAITETRQAVTVLILGKSTATLTTMPVHTTMAVVELPRPLDGRQLIGPGQGQGGW